VNIARPSLNTRRDVRLVPLIVGHPSSQNAARVSDALAKYWADLETFFVISSDFCHWGTRFHHTPYYPDAPAPPHPVPPVAKTSHSTPPTLQLLTRYTNPNVPIWQSIQYMDHEGVDLLRRPGEPGAIAQWEAYLSRTKVSRSRDPADHSRTQSAGEIQSPCSFT
jgi:predicted class III extradiol MEMO1 family dioxygenase